MPMILTRVGCLSLPVVAQCTDLGVSYDTHLNFSSHISRIVNKAAIRAKCILKCFSSRDSLIAAYACVLYICATALRVFLCYLEPILQK